MGKRITKLKAGVPAGAIKLAEAAKILKANAIAKFDETIDISMNLDVDPKQNDQNVRGMVQLPHGTGKTVRVAVFARGDKADAARAAGADLVGAEDLAEKIEKGELNFDRVIAAPDTMVIVGKLGKVLGPKGLMPNPKLGTVTADVAGAVKAAKAGQIEFRVEKAGIVQAGIGKASFTEAAITENLRSFISAVAKAKPPSVKGTFVKKITVSSTMGPGIKLDINATLAEVGK